LKIIIFKGIKLQKLLVIFFISISILWANMEDDLTIKEMELELKAKELELKEKELELELQQKNSVASQPQTFQTAQPMVYAVPVAQNRVDESLGGDVYISVRYMTGGTDSEYEYADSGDTWESDESLDTTVSSIKFGFGRFDENRVEWSYNTYTVDKIDDGFLGTRQGIGVNYVFTGSSKKFNPYLSLGFEYVMFDGEDSYGDAIAGLGGNLGLGFYFKPAKNFEVGLGYEVRVHMVELERGYYSSYYSSTETLTITDTMSGIVLDAILRF
jgi:hypothetical protein